ncbi:unnamed protein product [Rotaria sp. Silwood2]|nr:unnamed protein product [Rotaria sp. Silwood2]CAF3271559.1 unnamed protein product [Rotaria sp. Silwood2]CAF3393058.1 unnamed protein product [Rotaria sp. Silwood2]CAF4143372.1 unnamed protein product [Rotaria sp. Silwood2]CAF4265656.1 unnamed protein product [Rotaria sp. Silwood2]
MDFSDEQVKFDSAYCIFNSRNFDCDEHLCSKRQWSCGDGQCIADWNRFIFQTFIPKSNECYNYRDYNFLCELKHLWTTPSGLCYPFWIEFDLDMNGDRDEYCQYLLKCALSGGKELQCPCGSAVAENNDQYNCSIIMKELMCSNKSLLFPLKSGVIKPYMQFYYNIDHHNWLTNQDPDKIIFNGYIKCRGYQARGKMLEFDYNENFIFHSQFDFLFCNSSNVEKVYSGPFYDEYCWTKDSKTFQNKSYHFSDICKRTSKYCISDYRLLDGYDDCGGVQSEDELFNPFYSTNNSCLNQQKYRFTCSHEQQPTCLLVELLGNQVIDCLNGYDEFLFGHEMSLLNIKCQQTSKREGCQLLRQYIKYSWIKNQSAFKDIMSLTATLTYQSTSSAFSRLTPFHHYCDTFWDISSKNDENLLLCQKYWVCSKNQYRCLTGQCIPQEWLCDGK